MSEHPDQAGTLRRSVGRVDDHDGVLLVDKPAGWTSHDVVAKIRNHFRFRKVGHGGTLDPMATGLLVILLGRGTKLSSTVMGTDKVYEGTMRLGVTTDSHDIEGHIVAEQDGSIITREQLEERFLAHTGDQMQMPPMVSAIKCNGVPLYKLARKGKTVERKPRLIHVYRFKLKAFNPPDADFILLCTKGTYVRTLCHDIGQELGCGACLTRLRRLRVGALRVAHALTMEELLAMPSAELGRHVISAHDLEVE